MRGNRPYTFISTGLSMLAQHTRFRSGAVQEITAQRLLLLMASGVLNARQWRQRGDARNNLQPLLAADTLE